MPRDPDDFASMDEDPELDITDDEDPELGDDLYEDVVQGGVYDDEDPDELKVQRLAVAEPEELADDDE